MCVGSGGLLGARKRVEGCMVLGGGGGRAGRDTHLAKLADLFAEATYAGERGAAWVFETHFVDHRVHLAWEDAHDGQRGHVEADARPGLEFVCW